MTVQVAGVEEQPKVGFDSHIRPIISRMGCNAGACHASQFGKGGFVLSVVGFDSDLDYNAMVRDRQQRRVSLVQPEESLLLRKPTLQVAHGGGKKRREADEIRVFFLRFGDDLFRRHVLSEVEDFTSIIRQDNLPLSTDGSITSANASAPPPQNPASKTG